MKKLLQFIALGVFAVAVMTAAVVGIDCPGHGPVQMTELG